MSVRLLGELLTQALTIIICLVMYHNSKSCKICIYVSSHFIIRQYKNDFRLFHVLPFEIKKNSTLVYHGTPGDQTVYSFPALKRFSVEDNL
jgi:hypothetical protein